MTVHPTRTRKRRPGEPPAHCIVIHTSEQPRATVSSAQSLAAFIATPATAQNTASYHYGVDLDDEVVLVPEEDIAFQAPPNWRGIGICLTGRADRDWTGVSDGVDDTPELDLAARRCADICARKGWPVRRLTLAQLQAGEHGLCGHVDMSHAFKQSDHTDPGVGFPWQSFLALVESYLHPTHDKELIAMSGFEAIIHTANTAQQKAYVDHSAAGTAFTGLYEQADIDAVRESFRRSHPGFDILEASVSPAFYEDLRIKGLKSMGFPTSP